ncbi:MAG: hypothetical protein R2828_02535 [Saprospiraceae bacterium]
MLGLLLIYFIGKNFYDLAGKFNKNQWGFAIAGVVAYYLGTFIGGIVLAICFDLFGGTSIDEMNNFVLNLIALPFGILACLGLYLLLERNWERKRIQINLDILDEELPG